jgi:hypothetical protein
MFPRMTELPPPNIEPAPPPATHNDDPHARWRFVRDVAVFEFKLFLNNLHNFFQIPLTLAVAAYDLIVKGKYQGERFYKIVEYGRTIDDAIDIYSIVSHREKPLNTEFTVDALVGRLEGVIVREYEKGGTAASVRAALDRALDHVQDQTKGAAEMEDNLRRAAETAAGRFRERTGFSAAPDNQDKREG